jgi:hypothetical protein
VFFGLRSPEEKVMMALKMLLVKVALSDIGFVLDVTEETVLEWLRRAAQKAHEINTHLLRDLPVTQVQLDEMWNFIRRKQALQASPDGESTDCSEDGRQWIWISFAPEFRLIRPPRSEHRNMAHVAYPSACSWEAHPGSVCWATDV